jgi:Flp pilus assembly protein TadD
MATIQDALAIAWKLFQAGDLEGALRVYREVVEIEPRAVAAWQMMAAIHQLEGRLDQAITSYEQVLRLDPNHVEALNNLGVALHSQGQIAKALHCLQRALELKPDYADAHSNHGNALQEQGHLDSAVASYGQALQLKPAYFDALNNLGNTLRAQGKLAESVASYERALQVKPDNPQVRMSRALCWLQMGDFERGWPEYEWRLKCKEFSIPAFRQPLWDGSPLEGRPILLYADHGLGDSFQFIRYAPLVKARGGRVIVACQQPLARLMATCPGVDLVVAEGSLLPDFAFYAPLMSLPRILGTSLASIPAEVPYLTADTALVEQWHRELGPVEGYRIGIAWQGNPQYRRDHQRSFRLAQLEPLAWVTGVRLFSLQKSFGTEQIDELNGRFAVSDLGSRLSDFMDTAAVVRNLDLVITLDSSLAHLAGALAVPVWVAIPVAADWRWLTEREDSPWYPTMRLFRQTQWGDWDEVFERMAREICNLLDHVIQ